jgi:phosphoribosylformylglycinamidine synthase
VTHRFRVSIERKPGLSDPEGTTTKKALTDLGFGGVEAVSFGRIISLSVDAPDKETARSEIDAMCQKLLANPVMESYTIESVT